MRDKLRVGLLLVGVLLLLAACTAPGAADPRGEHASNKDSPGVVDMGGGGGGGGGY